MWSGLIRALPTCLMLGAGQAAFSEMIVDAAPKRVVSMNLCTDQLAMLVAAEDQLLSVSYLARDPRASAMAEHAIDYHSNRGLAEEIYLLDPDLVITGRFSTQTTVSMLRRLDIPVVVFDPAYALEDIPERVVQMGDVLGQGAKAAEIVEDYDARLARLQSETEARPRAALYYANGYTAGDRTLAGQILTAAGFANVASEAGFPDGGLMPLEILALSEPDAVITSQAHEGSSRAHDILDHPIVKEMRQSRYSGNFTDRDWVCGTPYVLRAIAELSAVHASVLDE